MCVLSVCGICLSLSLSLPPEDWRFRHAMLMAISAVGEGCEKQVQPILGEVVQAVLPFCQDPVRERRGREGERGREREREREKEREGEREGERGRGRGRGREGERERERRRGRERVMKNVQI